MLGRVSRLAESVLAVPRPHSVPTLRRQLNTETLRRLHPTSWRAKTVVPTAAKTVVPTASLAPARCPIDSTFNILHPHFGRGLKSYSGQGACPSALRRLPVPVSWSWISITWPNSAHAARALTRFCQAKRHCPPERRWLSPPLLDAPHCVARPQHGRSRSRFAVSAMTTARPDDPPEADISGRSPESREG